MPYYPSPEQAGIAWLNSLSLTADGIATTLPMDQNSWATHGFIQVRSIGGGGGLEQVMPRGTSLQIDCWATNPNSNKTPWGKAYQLAAQIWDACSDNTNQNVSLAVAAPGYYDLSVYSVYPLGELRRFSAHGSFGESTTKTTMDPSTGYARIQFDLMFNWQVKKVV